MSPRRSRLRPLDAVRASKGISILELMMALGIFMIVVFGFGSLYLASRRALDLGSAEAFVQRQGTLVQEEVTRQLQSANSLQVSKCRELNASSMAANQSIIYSVNFPGRTAGNQVDYFCIYEYQRTTDPFPQLWRCRLADTSPEQACTAGTVENLLPPVPSSVGGQQVRVMNTLITPVGITPTSASVDFRFDIDLHERSTVASSILLAPRRFGFSVAIRN